MSCDVQVVLIAAGVVAYWRRRAVDAGEEEEGDVLPRTIFDATENGTWCWANFVRGLGCSWASALGCCGLPSKFPSNSLFQILFAVFIFWFDFTI
jgi:hypothetical protein